jgi:subtilisin family serine protease
MVYFNLGAIFDRRGPMAHLRFMGVFLFGFSMLCGVHTVAADEKNQDSESWLELVDYSSNSSIIWAKNKADLDLLRRDLSQNNIPMNDIKDGMTDVPIFNTLTVRMRPEDAVAILKSPTFAKYDVSVTDNPIIHSFVGNCDDADIIPSIPTGSELTPDGVKRVYGGDPPEFTDGAKRAWIIDSGIATDTNISMDLNVNRGMSRRCNIKEGCVADTETDFLGHGTMLAGIIGAKSAMSIGLRGMAPGSTLISMKIFNRKIPANTVDVALEAFKYIEPNLNANDVINISWGTYFNPLKVDVSVDSAELRLESKLRELAMSKKVWIVVAAGNIDSGDSSGYVQTISPARAGAYRFDPGSGVTGAVMTISAVESRFLNAAWVDNFWRFSAFGNGYVRNPSSDEQSGPPDYAAPGVNIQSYWPGDKLNTCSGTSFGAAHVAGLMLYSKIPKNGGRARWDPSAIKPGIALPGGSPINDYYEKLRDPIAIR